MKKYFEKAISYFIYLVGSAGLCTLLWIVLAIPVRLILEKSNDKILWELICGVVIFTIICFGLIFFCGYKNGYKTVDSNFKNIFVPMLMACAMHFIFSSIFQFAVYTTAPSFYLGAVIYHITVKAFDKVYLPIVYRIATLWIFYLLYLVAALFGEKRGVKKRLIDRERLIKQENQ